MTKAALRIRRVWGGGMANRSTDTPTGDDREFDCFSSPIISFNQALCDAIVVAHARCAVAEFLSRYSRAISSTSDGLIDRIEAWTRELVYLRDVWHLSCGLVDAAICSAYAGDILPVAAELSLISPPQQEVQWECHFAAAADVRIGQHLLSRVSHLRVKASPAQLDLLVLPEAGERLAFDWTGSCWHCPRLESLPTVHLGEVSLTLLHESTLGLLSDKWFPRTPIQAIQPSTFQSIQDALQILQSHAPEYAVWVSRVLKSCILLSDTPGQLISGSSPYLYGATYMCPEPDPFAVCEMLIYEASHQYYHILSWLGSMDDGSDLSKYYSPIKRTERSIANILLAYHAFANVLIFYRICIRKGLSDGGYCKRSHDALLPELEQLDTALRKTSSLTMYGQALWRPLADILKRSV